MADQFDLASLGKAALGRQKNEAAGDKGREKNWEVQERRSRAEEQRWKRSRQKGVRTMRCEATTAGEEALGGKGHG